MTTLRRHLPTLALVLGAVSVALVVPTVLGTSGAVDGRPWLKELPWLAGMAVFVIAAAIVRRRLPDHPVAWWFGIAAGLAAVIQALDGATLRLEGTDRTSLLAWALLGYQLTSVIVLVAIAQLLARFPDGHLHRRYERVAMRALWWLLVLPPLVFLGRPTLLSPSYHQAPEAANPYQLPVLAPVGEVAGWGVAVMQGAFAVGAVLLVLRYRRSSADDRRRIRWLLLPGLFAAAVAVIDTAAWRLYPEGPPNAAIEIVFGFLWIPVIASLPVAIAIALLRPDLLDVDSLIRKSLVYGLLWAAIGVAYIAAAASLGMAAVQRLPLTVAIALTVAATLVFQPARRRLERLADRWVFGVRADPSRLISRLGSALEETVKLEALLPRMADTLQEGLGLRWARVRLEPAPAGATADVSDSDDPALTVPIVLGDEQVGVVECGPKLTGVLTEEDASVVATFARQAALAVRNVRLTAELERSRSRLVRAQEAERRRLERNIHDGVQQDLVALIGHTAHVRSELQRDPHAGEQALTELQDGLRRVIVELRELAHGIHPSVLSDRGLLEAVEALASRSALPVSVRADPSLRGARFAEEIEGAGYFTIAEALANAGKHAGARHVEVSLSAAEGDLRIAVRDDGCGFDPATVVGDGLANLAERLAALGGRLEVSSRPGDGTIVSASLGVAGA